MKKEEGGSSQASTARETVAEKSSRKDHDRNPVQSKSFTGH